MLVISLPPVLMKLATYALMQAKFSHHVAKCSIPTQLPQVTESSYLTWLRWNEYKSGVFVLDLPVQARQ